MSPAEKKAQRIENQEKYLYNAGALGSILTLWYCAYTGMGTPEAIIAVFGVFLGCTIASLVRKISKYKSGASFLNELKSFNFSKDGVSVEMKDEGPTE